MANDDTPGDGVTRAELEAVPATKVVAGRSAELLTYNRAFPGPLLRFREGDRVRIGLTNRLGEPSNLHLHGLHVPLEVDDPARMVADGDTIVYEFDVLPGSAGTYWYHPHAHGSVSPQLFGGLAGALVIDGPDDPAELADADEQILVLKDLAIDGSRVSPHTADDWLNGKEGDLLLVNGEVQPRIVTSSGLLRLRLINACNARYFLLGVEDHQLTVLGAGIGFAEAPLTVAELLLAPGERADVLVALHRSEVDLAALPYDRGADMSGMDDMAHRSVMAGTEHPVTADKGHSMQGPDAGHGQVADHGAGGRLGNRQPMTLATFTAPEPAPPLRLPARLASLPTHGPDEVRARRRIVLSEEMGHRPVRFLLNGQAFEPGRIDFRSQLGSIEVWEVVNDADMDHPFHLHVYPFIVLGRNGEPEPVRMWRDTVNLAAGDRVELLVPFEHFSGTAIYHCHIVEHEDRGMMACFAVDQGNHDAIPLRRCPGD